MIYEIFLETVKQRLQQELGPDYRLELHSVQKNNGITLDGLSIFAPGCRLAPTIYLNPYYELLTKQHVTLDEICADIRRTAADSQPAQALGETPLFDFEAISPNIMMKLVHTASNQALLADAPHISYLDLSIVFYLLLESQEDGQRTLVIRNNLLKAWKTDERNLLHIAAANTPRRYPAHIHAMNDVMTGVARQDVDGPLPLYLLTNERGIFGAACILYQNVLKNFANLLNRNLVIIPSSVHEVLLTPYETSLSYKGLNTMVAAINRGEVPREDQLSNHVYLYDRRVDRIFIK